MMSDTFDDIGFLSPMVDTWAKHVRAEFGDHFEIADRLNRLGMRVLFALPVAEISSQAQDYSARSFARALETFQTAILLSHIGAVAEARALVRLCCEAAIAIGALKADPAGFVGKLHEDYQRQRRATANAVLEGANGEKPEGEQADRLRAILAEIQQTYGKRELRSIKWEAAAASAKMKGFYDMVYRLTSANAAHLNLGSMDRHAVGDESNQLIGYSFRPDKRDLRSTLFAANATVLAAISLLVEQFGMTQFADEMTELTNRWRATESDDR